MTKLDLFEKQLVEKLFQMEGGYVLNFSNRTMGEFFQSELDVNIYDQKYNYGSGSKANFVRGFINVENDQIVGRAIQKLVKYIENNILLGNLKERDFPEALIKAVKDIATKLINSHGIKNKEKVDDAQTNSPFDSEWFKLFISHRDSFKIKAKEIKEELKIFGISSFVAHEDIEPTKEWVVEIERALFSMDAMLALLSVDFSKSVWTNQEIGVAYGRGSFILPVRLGEDPQGFVGKFQALRPESDDMTKISLQIVERLLINECTAGMMKRSYFKALLETTLYSESEKWAKILPFIKNVNAEEVEILINSFNNNDQAYDCFALNGGRFKKDSTIADKINDWLGEKKYVLYGNKIGKIESRKI